MGGNALKKYGVDTVRFDARKYVEIGGELINVMLPTVFPKSKTHLVKAYSGKEDFGDVDILVSTYDGMPDPMAAIKHERIWKSKVWVKNGNVCTFDYKNFQVDLIFVGNKDWDTSIDFYDYDPSGNLMGKIAHKFGLKYGMVGLVYPYRSKLNSSVQRDIILSKDSREIFNFLGFDYEVYLDGFDTLVQIFDYVVHSKYYDMEHFRYENLNAVDRKRNRKRKTYNDFLEYVNNNNFAYTTLNKFSKDKEYYLPLVESVFPEANLFAKIEELDKRSQTLADIKSKFNGKLVMERIPFLQDRALGEAMSQFRAKWESEEQYEEYVLSHSREEIMKEFIRFYYDKNIILNACSSDRKP